MIGIQQFSIFSRRIPRVLKFTQPFQPFQPPHEPTTNRTGPSDLLRQNFFGGRALHVASISENPEVTRCRWGWRFDGRWMGQWMVVGRISSAQIQSKHLQLNIRRTRTLPWLVRRFTKNWSYLFGDFLKHQHYGPHQPAVEMCKNKQHQYFTTNVMVDPLFSLGTEPFLPADVFQQS